MSSEKGHRHKGRYESHHVGRWKEKEKKQHVQTHSTLTENTNIQKEMIKGGRHLPSQFYPTQHCVILLEFNLRKICHIIIY